MYYHMEVLRGVLYPEAHINRSEKKESPKILSLDVSQSSLATAMSLSAWRNGVLGPERAIQEMTTGERRTSYASNSRDAGAERRSIRTASPHAKREHAIEHCWYACKLVSTKRRHTKKEEALIRAYVRVAMNALAVVWQVRWESASGGLTPSSVRR
jgi:hypothetical protein